MVKSGNADIPPMSWPEVAPLTNEYVISISAMTLKESKVILVGGYGGGTWHASMEVLDLCFAAIENVKKHIENVDKCIAQVCGSINPIRKKNKIARLEKVQQHLVECCA